MTPIAPNVCLMHNPKYFFTFWYKTRKLPNIFDDFPVLFILGIYKKEKKKVSKY